VGDHYFVVAAYRVVEDAPLNNMEEAADAPDMAAVDGTAFAVEADAC